MKKINHPSLDTGLLYVFLTVLDTLSATEAARQLGVSQSAISHALGRLRTFLGDPLFVRSGNALVPTERALALKTPVQQTIDRLESLTHHRAFDPQKDQLDFVVAGNDLQLELIFPQLIRERDAQDIPISFEFITSGHPTIGMMRDGKCHLALSPFPPDALDIVQKRIFAANMMCFFDASVRGAPKSWEEYCESEHVAVKFSDGGTSRRALTGVDKSQINPGRLSVPNFGLVPAFVKGSRRIATEIDLMKLCCLKELDMAPLPVKTDPVIMYMTWHQRNTQQPAHIWLREQIQRIAIDVRKML